MNYVDTPYSICRIGVARCDVTPPVGIYHRTWGAATHDIASAVHRPLTATALVFQAMDKAQESHGEQIVIAVDHCLLLAGDMEKLLHSVSKQTGVPREHLEVAFSHTHGAGLLDSGRGHLPGGNLIQPYLDMLTNRVADIVQQARRNVQPATLSYVTGHSPLAAHRDFWDETTKQFVCGFNPEGPVDDSVLVVRVTGSTGATLATVVNYACHPTTLAWQNTLISPDYPGALREVVEQATGAPCVFLQGASGDIGPREGYVGDVAVADRNGRQLGYAVLAALESLPPARTRFQYAGPVVSGATLGTWVHTALDEQALTGKMRWRLRRWTVDLNYRDGLPTVAQTQRARDDWHAQEQAALRAGDQDRARDCHALVERQDRWLARFKTLPPGPSFPLPITLWQIGDAVWLNVEAEHYNMLQRDLRSRFPGVPLIVTTIVNGSRAVYLPPADVYGKGIYQESIAVLAPGSLEKLIDHIAAQIGQWQDD